MEAVCRLQENVIYDYSKREQYYTKRPLVRKAKTSAAKKAVCSIAFIFLFLGLMLVLTLALRPAKKASAKSDLYESRLTSVRVEKNDSLWKIAEKYYCSEKETVAQFVQKIKKANNLTSDTIYPDTYLVIPYSVAKDLD